VNVDEFFWVNSVEYGYESIPINTYKYHLKGDGHPFASYFGVHQGYRVLTHMTFANSTLW